MATEKNLAKQISPTEMPAAAGHTHLGVDKAMIQVTVSDSEGRKSLIEGAQVCVYRDESLTDLLTEVETDSNGEAAIEVERGTYWVTAKAFVPTDEKAKVDLKDGGCKIHPFSIPVGFDLECIPCRDSAKATCPDLISERTPVLLRIKFCDAIEKDLSSFLKSVVLKMSSSRAPIIMTGPREGYMNPAGFSGTNEVNVVMRGLNSPLMSIKEALNVIAEAAQSISGDLSVKLGRTATAETSDMPLWTVIRAATEATSFNTYKTFIDAVMCGKAPYENGDPKGPRINCSTRNLPYPGVDAYSLVKCATEVFLMAHCGVVLNSVDFKTFFDNSDITLLEEQGRFGREITADRLNELWSTGSTDTNPYLVGVNGDEASGYKVMTLPYLALIRSKLGDVPLKDDTSSGNTAADVANCYGILQKKLARPCLIELIWSYWHEEGMLVQTMKAISMRFQNKRGRAEVEPLMRFDIDPLRPLNNLLWGYIQDEQHRLTILRRAYEYDHHYGVTLQGRAVPALHTVDGRSKFLEAFHNLLYLCSVFFKEDDDTTVIADGFPVMNAIREVHLLLAEGAHNQFGDLPSTARQEMLIEQWLLARPEMREFLGGRIMVPYSEPWMDRVDTVKRIEAWTDTTVTDFHYLAVYGEQILLSIRYGNWTDVNDPTQAANWARYWRAEIQSYVHSYRAVTGVDLTLETGGLRQASERYAPPSVHLRRRLETQLVSKR